MLKLGTKQHHDVLLGPIDSLDDTGCFALTELGFGEATSTAAACCPALCGLQPAWTCADDVVLGPAPIPTSGQHCCSLILKAIHVYVSNNPDFTL